MELSKRQNKLIIAAVASFAIFAVVAVGSVSLLAVTRLDRSASGQERVPRVLSGEEAKVSKLAGALTGAVKAGGAYTPTSKYVEPGADRDEIDLVMHEDGHGKAARPIDEEEIRSTVFARQNDLITCYAEALDRDPDLQGRVDLHFRIAGDGRVAMVKVTQSGLRDRPTEDCLVEKARAWRFPQSGSEQLARFDTDFMFTY